MSATRRALPDELDLSDIMSDMERLWQQTVRDHSEWGACIVEDAHGKLKLTHKVRGTLTGVNPWHRNSGWVRRHPGHVGFFHTHVLRSDGSEQVGFSDTDFAGVLEDGECLSVARNGQHVYALVRTASTRLPGLGANTEEKAFENVFKDWLRHDPSNAERNANLELCQQLGLAFYAGLVGQPLQREFRP